MHLGERIRLYPTDEQVRQFKQFCGTARFAYNECLAYRIAEFKNSGKSVSVQGMIEHLQDLKYNNADYAWLCDVPEAITKQAIKDLDNAYKNFSNGVIRSFLGLNIGGGALSLFISAQTDFICPMKRISK